MLLRRLYSTAAHPARFKLPPTIKQVLSANGSESSTTSVTGWIKSIRKQKNITFAVVSDGTTPEGLQAVVSKERGTSPEMLKRLTNGTAVRLTGNLIQSPGRGQEWELVIQEGDKNAIEILGDCDIDTYPIQKKSLSIEYLRDNAYLRARTGQIAAMLRLRDSISKNLSRHFESQGFTYTHTPIITASDCEGAGEAFRISPIQPTTPSLSKTDASSDANTPIEFFSRPAYLTVSHQLHLESFTTALSRVYTLSPCFRAERSMTGRHLAEFWMLEAEWNLATRCDSIEEICAFVEGLIRTSVDHDSQDVKALWAEKGMEVEEFKMFRAAFDNAQPWRRLTYTDAVEALSTAYVNGHPFEFKPVWGESLSSEHERWLAEVYVGGPVFVTDYPIKLKPFYMRVNEDGKTVACFDLIVPHVGELVGGSVREERWDVLSKRMAEHGLLPHPDQNEDATTDSTYQWYLDLRKYGGAPHAGFGLGFERLVSWVGGIDNVRECIGMPRWTGRMIM
ncbi:hypothetical protein AGABI1DRAFT_76524 [Agaricus bisporus var. burnettii JB137-S8]|uniref:asparagine--tRNA ligase n=1 Tax=Agaricus bisporus var. burnettii (strain JB137-S8 / ATCC MYA-4627 / FGSC 10392) TaxID=597362 RepID=K5X4P0_AGABU|nr:uncharacterized protein AGABI1DRAFT_76524 [Agaricus bisporus var. burnettii JB137-S8]EKM78118.1 hypothetical protein AGABI1DRAFT_76524 [Agaricus bisporus var. burnettii JB137-S8]